MNPGKIFENKFKDSVDKSPYYGLRLIDSNKWGREGSFTPKNIADFLIHVPPKLFVLELKSTKGPSISFNAIEFNKNTLVSYPWHKDMNDKDIKGYQVLNLMKINKEQVIPGFIFNYRDRVLKTKSEPYEVFFVHIEKFLEFAITSGKASINRVEAMQYGIKIYCEKKRVHYKHDIDCLANIDYFDFKNIKLKDRQYDYLKESLC